MIYITGDTHGAFGRIERFCARQRTTREDVLIILGDAGINYYGFSRDYFRKQAIAQLPVTLFCIHGNHEQRPETIPSYRLVPWRGGQVYVEEEFPTLLFARDGEIFDLDGAQTLVVGGAYSVDKYIRVGRGYPWWPDEQPSPEIRARVEARLEECGWKVDAVLSHTTPLKFEPVEAFLPGFDPAGVDKSTEIWLDSIEGRLDYRRWFCGHYHIEKRTERLRILFEEIEEFAL